MKTTGGGEEVDRGYSAGSIPPGVFRRRGGRPGVFRREYSAAVSCSQGDSAASSRMKTPGVFCREYSGSEEVDRGYSAVRDAFFFFFFVCSVVRDAFLCDASSRMKTPGVFRRCLVLADGRRPGVFFFFFSSASRTGEGRLYFFSCSDTMWKYNLGF